MLPSAVRRTKTASIPAPIDPVVRTFVAVFPPQSVREALFRAARDLPASKAFRLIGREKLHLTLKFLGNVAEDDLIRV